MTLELGGGAVLANRSTDKRRALDFYPTPPDVTHALMLFMAHWRKMMIWEPAAGDGAMARVLREYDNKVFESDIASPSGAHGADFLKVGWNGDGNPARWPPLDAIITNPPFAQSEAFIRHALKQTPNVAMLLKSQYWHAQRRLELFRETRPSYVLPLTWRPDFGGGGAPTMEVYWTVWTDRLWRSGVEYGGDFCEYVPLERP